jgi:mRNA interferase MazF
MARYVPARGDLVWLRLHPQFGHEQAGNRPALVLSPKSYNRLTGLCIICPATRQVKGYAFEVDLADPNDPGVLLADHVRCVDWRARGAKFIRRVRETLLDEVVGKLVALIVEPDESR